MPFSKNALVQLVMRYASRLRYPNLFLVILGVFLLDVLIPDALPFVDEILFALITLLLGSMKKEKDPGEVDASWREE